MEPKKVLKYVKSENYETNLNYAINNILQRIIERGYTLNQAKKLLASELMAGWNQDAILEGIERLEERAEK